MSNTQVAFTEVLGQVVRQHRGRQRQEDLAPALAISPSAWSRIEAGKTSMTVVQLRRVAEVMGTDAWALLREAERVAEKIQTRSPGMEVVDEPPKKGRGSAAGLFISGAAVGALVAGLFSSSRSRKR